MKQVNVREEEPGIEPPNCGLALKARAAPSAGEQEELQQKSKHLIGQNEAAV